MSGKRKMIVHWTSRCQTHKLLHGGLELHEVDVVAFVQIVLLELGLQLLNLLARQVGELCSMRKRSESHRRWSEERGRRTCVGVEDLAGWRGAGLWGSLRARKRKVMRRL